MAIGDQENEEGLREVDKQVDEMETKRSGGKTGPHVKTSKEHKGIWERLDKGPKANT